MLIKSFPDVYRAGWIKFSTLIIYVTIFPLYIALRRKLLRNLCGMDSGCYCCLQMSALQVKNRKRKEQISMLARKRMISRCLVLLLLLTTSSVLRVAEARNHGHNHTGSEPSNTTLPAPPPRAPSPRSKVNGSSPGKAPIISIAPAPSNQDIASEDVAKHLQGFSQYQTIAEGVESVERFLIIPNTTLFAPYDGALDLVGHLTGESAMALLNFHLVSRRLNFSELSELEPGTKLSTNLSNITVVVTNNSADHFMVDNALVINPDMFLDERIAVHGIDHVFDVAAYNNIMSLGPPSPGDEVPFDDAAPLQTVPTPITFGSASSPTPNSASAPAGPSSEFPMPADSVSPGSPVCTYCLPHLVVPSDSPPRPNSKTNFISARIGQAGIITGTTIFVVYSHFREPLEF